MTVALATVPSSLTGHAAVSAGARLGSYAVIDGTADLVALAIAVVHRVAGGD